MNKETLEAYSTAEYHVLSAQSFTLKVGIRSAGLADLYRRLGVDTSAFITAFNPYSKVLGKNENTKRNESLKEDLDKISFVIIQGYGQDPKGLWEKEDSFLAFGISKEQAIELGKKYEQNAILWCDKNCIPELTLLR